MPDVGAWVVGSDGVRRRKGRPDRGAIAPPPPPPDRPTGPGYYALEDLGVGLDLAAGYAKVRTLATGTRADGTTHRTLTLPAGTFEAIGFSKGANSSYGFLWDQGVSIEGSGPSLTIVRVKPDTITQTTVDKNVVPIDDYPNNNGMRTAIMTSGGMTNLRLANLHIQGTQQRVGGTQTQGAGWDTYHYTNLMLSGLTNPTIENVKVSSTPGYRNSPPGETAAFALLGGSGAVFTNCENDGRRSWGDGSKISGAGFSTSSSSNVTFKNCNSHHNGFSHGFAFWQTNNITCSDCVSTDNGGGNSASLGGTAGDGFNFERSRSSKLIRCTVGRNTLSELRYYAKNAGDAYDGDTGPHIIQDLVLLEGNLDIKIDSQGSTTIQTTLPTFQGTNPTPHYTYG